MNGTNKKHSRLIALLMVIVLILGMMPIGVFAESNTVKISSAADLPTSLEAGITYELTADIELASGQQIEMLAGILDGKGHTVTLNGKPLAKNVTGTIQNLGVLGSATESGVFGSIAVNLSGIIQNCYSLVNLSSSGWDDVGGLVGNLNGGNIKNSYFAGNNTAMFADGLVGIATGGTISNVCYNTGYSAIGMGGNKVTQTNVVKKSNSDMKLSSTVDILNTDISTTGYFWKLSTTDGFPVLEAGTFVDSVDKTGLEVAIDNAKSLDKDIYEANTWSKVETALAIAETVFADDDATKAEVKEATANLENAIKALEKKKAIEPVAKPIDETKIVHIKTQAQLEAIGSGDPNKYYILGNDLTLDNWYMSFGEFNGVFDGNGYTITYNNSYTSLFQTLGVNGVVQNVHFKGSLRSAADAGAVAREVKGSVVNCYSEVSGETTSGFAKRLNGGMISNCYSISTAKAGVIIGTANDTYTGTLKNVYWQEDLEQTADLSKLTTENVVALRYSAMTTLDFVDTLNKSKGQYGVSWGQNSDGYPYFGENLGFVPGAVELPETAGVEMSFTPNGSATEKIDNQELAVDKNKANLSGYVGKFALVDYVVPEGAKVVWDCVQQIPEGTAAINKENSMYEEDAGEFYAYKEGTVVVTATLEKAGGEKTVLAATKVDTFAAEIEKIKIYVADYDGKNIVAPIDGKVTVAGSQDKKIVVEAKYKDSNVYQSVAATSFNFTIEAEAGLVKHSENSSSFSFNEPGTAKMIVTYKNNNAVTASVELTSEYVAVSAVTPGINGTYILHSRDGNGSNSAPFVTIYANPVIVTPDNASYKGNYTVTSSDATIAEYIKSMANGFVPYKAGTVTFTTTIDDNGNKVSGSSIVSFEYLNPLKAVSVQNKQITMKNGETVSAGLLFEGTLDTLKHISETGMIWSYDKEGIVTVVREGGAWYNDGTPENTGYFLSDQYNIKALSEGTVTITGTPVDNTAGAQPITIKVTVAKSNLPIVDIDKIISEGIAISRDYMLSKMENGLTYGSEWMVVTLLRADKDVDKALLDQYYDSVLEEIKTWDGSEKPTDIERVALALSAMGKDITDVEGINLAEMIYNNDKLTYGSNELAWALLALDATGIEIPADAKWTRDKMIAEMLKFQNEDGFFGLGDNKSASLDMTAMCLQALAPYRGNQIVDKAIAKGLNYLRTNISGNYDYGDSNATAQVLLTLAVLGIDVTDSTNGFGTAYDNIISRLDDFRTSDGFSYTLGSKTNMIATYQIMQSFDAYRKAQDEGISYWDFTEKSDEEYDDKIEVDNNNNNNNNDSGKGSSTESTPVTGDENIMTIWLALMAAMAASIVAIRRKEN